MGKHYSSYDTHVAQRLRKQENACLLEEVPWRGPEIVTWGSFITMVQKSQNSQVFKTRIPTKGRRRI